MTYDIVRNEVVKRFRLTVVPGFQEAPDYGLVLLRRRAHRCLL
jgi:hypothetical protein